MSVLPTCIYASLMPSKVGRAKSPATVDGCELPCEFWDLNSGLLQEQQVFLTTESSVQPLSVFSVRRGLLECN